MKSEIACPVDFVLVNENRVRLVALLVLALALVYLLQGWWGIIVFLVIDFLLRSFDLGKYSPLFAIAGALVKLFGIGHTPTDRASKRFAARMGFAFTLIILLFHFLQIGYITVALTLTLCCFAFLECALAICVGCYVYAFYHKLLGK